MAASEKGLQPSIQREAIVSRLRDFLLSREIILFLMLVISMVLLSSLSIQFRQTENILNQLRLLSEVWLVALPMTFIIITGGIDLSVGASFALSAVMLGYSFKNMGLPLEAAIVVALLTGAICGLVNGLFIVRVGVPPLIMTLATLALYRGMALGISQARQVSEYPEWFYQLGLGEVLGIPTQLWIVLIATIIAGVVLAWTVFGRSIYAIGSNTVGARFSGIPVNLYKLIIYTFSGLMSGLAGTVFVSRVSTTRSDMGTGLELTVITAVVLGGTSIFGGSGTIVGTVIGLVLVQLLQNGLALAGVKYESTQVVNGIVLIVAVLLNSLIQRRRGAA